MRNFIYILEFQLYCKCIWL